MNSSGSDTASPAFASQIEKLRAYFDQSASSRDRWKRQNEYYYRELENLFRSLVPAHSRVLEIGSGTGDLLNAVSPSRGVGIDFSPAMVATAQKKFPHLEFRCMDAHQLSLNEKFDVVILSDLIGDLEDVLTVLENLHQVATPETRIVISYYNYLWEPVLKLGEQFHLKTRQALQNWLPMADVSNFLYLSGFETIKTGTRLLLPIDVPLFSWLFNRFLVPLPFFRSLALVEFMVARRAPSPVQDPWGAPSRQEYSCSVIIPCRNEVENIEPAVKRIPPLGGHTEILFVDGNSTDGTVEKIHEVMEKYRGQKDIKFIRQGKGFGKGDAVRKGFAEASGDVLMILDADLTVTPEELPKFFKPLATGKGEFINGSRLVYPMEEQAMRFLNLLGNKFFSLMFTWILGQRIRDTLCGTKVLLKRDYERIAAHRAFFGDFDPFGDFDLLFGAARLNLKIVEVPVRYRERTYGTTKISRFRHGWLLLKMVLLAFRKFKMN